MAVAVLLPGNLHAQADLANTNERIPSADSRGLAIGGYDVVAYFDYEEPTMGDPEIYFDYLNTYRFRFASKVTQRKFMGDPETYIPAYGGYCAYMLGLQKGEIPGTKPGFYRADPKFYKIIDGRVYLFSSAEALEKWNADEAGYRGRADANFGAILTAKQPKK